MENWMLTPGACLHDYMNNLKREADEILVTRSAERAAQLKPLHTIIGEWYASLPPPHRAPYYTTAALAKRFNTVPRFVGTALHKLGWQRKRQWTGGGPYTRYWVPPHKPTTPHPF
jgi:hypothetical protein